MVAVAAPGVLRAQFTGAFADGTRFQDAQLVGWSDGKAPPRIQVAAPDEKGRDLDAEPEDGDGSDELFEDAVRLVLEFGKASTSLLQRRLRIGYGRAAHLIDLMERDGIVGPSDGSKPREILKPPDWISQIEPAMR